jgi:hypothetical protein
MLFGVLGRRVLIQIEAILMCINCAFSLSDFFLCGWHAMQGLDTKNEKKLSRSLNLSFLHLHVYNVLLINNSKLGDYLDCIYHFELELNDTTGTIKSDSSIDQHITITVSAG